MTLKGHEGAPRLLSNIGHFREQRGTQSPAPQGFKADKAHPAMCSPGEMTI